MNRLLTISWFLLVSGCIDKHLDEPAGSEPISCDDFEALEAPVLKAVQEAHARADRRCATVQDCQAVSLSVRCAPACGSGSVARSASADFEAEIADIDHRLCRRFDECGLGPPIVECLQPAEGNVFAEDCVDGECTIVEKPRDL